MVGPDGAPSEPVRTGVTIEVLVSVDQHNPDADHSIIETCVKLQQLAGQSNTVTLVTGDAGMHMGPPSAEPGWWRCPRTTFETQTRVAVHGRGTDAAVRPV